MEQCWKNDPRSLSRKFNMKILLGVPEYPPYHIGGGGEVYKNLAENYKKLGHDIIVIYGYYSVKSWSEDIKKWIDKNGIKFYQIPEIPYPKSMPFLRTAMPPNLKAWMQLKKIIKKEDPDVVHLHGYGLIFVNILSSILSKLNIKYIFTIHGYPETQNKYNFLIKTIWDLYIKFIMGKTLEKAYKITCVSDFIKKDRRNIYKNKSTTIYNGINFDDYKNVKNDIDIRKKYNIDNETKIIFSLGRISEMKGFQEIVKLIPKFLADGIKVKYLIAGRDDGYKKQLDKLIDNLNVEKYVEFVGFLDLETKKQYLNQCDILAIPSFWEPFGLVALEGMIYNKTILTSDIGGLKEVLDNYGKKICLNSDKLISQINAKKKTQSNYNLERYDYKYISKLYINLMQ